MRIFKRLYLYQCEKREKYFLISQCNASKILLFWLSVERKKVPKISRLSKHPLHLFRRLLSHIEKIWPLGAKHCTFIYIQEFYIHEGNNNIMILLVFRRHCLRCNSSSRFKRANSQRHLFSFPVQDGFKKTPTWPFIYLNFLHC